MNINQKSSNFLSVLPLKNVVALPKSIIPVVVGRDVSVKAVDFALKNKKHIFVTAQKQTNVEKPTVRDIYHVGCRANILQVARLSNGSLKILIEGLVRSRIVEVQQEDGFIGVLAQDMVALPIDDNSEKKALLRNLFNSFKRYASLNEKIPEGAVNVLSGLTDLAQLIDSIAVQLPLGFNERQDLLEMMDVKQRSIRVSAILNEELEILKVDKNIRKRVEKQVEKNQKDYYLNEQMRAIQRELGREDFQVEIDVLRQKAFDAKLPKESGERVETECKRLEQMQSTSPEATVSRNYVEWLINVPWHKQTKDSVSIKTAEKILNNSHAGMKKAKERILEFLATKKFAKDKLKRSPIICLVGPPGVGKTSLALSVAESLGRKMVRISLGGMRDEAEIRGHRRTYIGAMPGKIVQSMKKAGVINPVIVLDEIDKMATDFRGDPASAMLEVLDPEQNKAFGDYFLEVDYDLSKVMFITTANVMENIPYPLLDRMEIIHLEGYTQKEKLEIAKNFLLPRLLDEHALSDKQVVLSDSILDRLIEFYTKEAGVRHLEQVIAKILRKSIQRLQEDKKIKKVVVTKSDLIKWLGVEKYRLAEKEHKEEIGLATGLAWTEVGGEILEIEVVLLPGKGSFSLTGQLGEVMQESAQAALSYIRSRAIELGLKKNFYTSYDIHMHIPEGAIPKDGPSAGITIAIALISALTKIPIQKKVAMTGEVTLRGRVLGVGGLKEKLLAAIRHGITKVVAPKENEPDIKEFEKELDKSLTIIYADNMDLVVNEVLVKAPLKKKVVKKKKRVVKKKSSRKR